MSKMPKEIWASTEAGDCLANYYFAEPVEHGVKYIRADINEWQPIEQKPDEHKAYLICNHKSDYVTIAVYRAGLWFDYDGNPEPWDDVTHWMPLPEPPKE